MQISSICVLGGNTPSGTLEVTCDSVRSSIRLTEHDAQQVMYLAERLYEAHQQRIAEAFRQPLPSLGHFTEVDDDPF